MIDFKTFQLENGLKVMVHEDASTPMAVTNILYDVGARDEEEERTGFAHLFEHLMFEGSVNISNYDKPLEKAGGISNAFTNNDITNYYNVVPANNLEVAFWLESDRMLSLNFNQHSLDVQKKVVMEEFKEHYINQPYGDTWHLVNALAYQVHPYRWPTIGKNLEHIESATLQDVKDFFSKFYRPNNAIMVVAGNVKLSQVKDLAHKWFGDIPAGDVPERNLPQEPQQKKSRVEEVKADVPLDAIFKMYHIGKRTDKDYYYNDVLSDILDVGHSARLYQNLVKEQKLFNEVTAYITSTFDPGLFVIEGKLSEGADMKKAEAAIDEELGMLKEYLIEENELEKIKNRAEASKIFGETNLFNKAFNLAYFELLGDASLTNKEVEQYRAVQPEQLQEQAQKVFQPENCSTLYYYSKT